MARLHVLHLLAPMAVLAAPPAATAQWNCETVMKSPAPGAFAEWKTEQGNMTMALLGNEDGRFRLEMQMSGVSGIEGSAVIQMLVPRYPWEGGDALEYIMQVGSNPPMKISGQMLGMMRSRLGSTDLKGLEKCTTMTHLGRAEIQVAAGTFTTDHLKDPESGAEFWVSGDVPFGMVRMKGPQGSIELVKKGTGYKTQITGTPTEMPGMRRP